jgi:transglutaminase-like putative cysteine protease
MTTLQHVIRHVNRFTYSTPISESTMEARMQPRGDGRQRVLRFELATQPRARVFTYQDPWGNVIHHFDVPSRHSRFSITADAIIEIAPAPPIPDTVSRDAWDLLDRLMAAGEEWDNLHPSRFARDSQLLLDLAAELDWQRHDDPLTMMRRLNHALFQQFTYAPRSTHVDSPIDDALKARAGVCQDLTHIMIALARRVGIPCRYVSGYLSTSEASHDRSAEGATHAWAEAFLPSIGWVGFDPTNDVLTADRHVRVALGRDYGDVPPTKGVFRGQAASELSVLVTVSLVDAPVRAERLKPVVTWVAAEGAAPTDSFEQAQQQQQQ